MSEPKPIWIADYSPSLNGEPLSTKQLHEVIVSQSMTIDRLLGEVGRYRAAMEQMRKQYKKGHYIIQVTPEIAKVLNEIP